MICLPYGVRAERVYEGIRLYREEPAADMERESIEVTGEMLSRAEKEEVVLALPDGRLHLRIRDFSGNMQEIPKKTYTKWFDYDKIKNSPCVRTRRQGDFLVVNREGGRKKLNRVFIDEKIPASLRDKLPVVATDSEILWIPGGRMNEQYKITSTTGRVLELHYQGGVLT